MRYLRMQRSLRLKRRTQRQPDDLMQNGNRPITPERDVSTASVPPRRSNEGGGQ